MKNKKLLSRLTAAAAALVITAGSLCAPVYTGMSAYAGQQLGQVDFQNGVGLPWHICESIAGEMEFEIKDGKYVITIINPGGASNGGEDRWDCQFRHRGLKIVAGHKYRVSYEITPSNSGKYYTKIGNLEGDVEIWHNSSTGDWDLDSTWDPIPIGANETKKVDMTFTAGQSLDVAEWAFHLGGDGQYTPGGCFPAGTVITFDNMSLIDMTSDENDYVEPEKWERSEILVNQLGYFTDRRKQATMLCNEKSGIGFEVKDSSGKSVFEGTTERFGGDPDSGDNVHIVDFTELDEPGEYYIEAENGAKSRTFTIGGSEKYSSMLYDSLNYFYQNRSGIEIESDFITSGDKNALARAAGHTSDNAEIQQIWGYNGSSGSVDVTGGWYDAGDHGKYVVNGGFSLWLMQNQYETALKYGFEDVYADGTMYLPECNNSYPDLLDEARWEMEWMFKMMVSSGDYEGMAYHKAHDETWTGLGVAPADDDKKRIIKPPTTAATLNLAACAAQASRLWEELDPSFAEECLDAAKKSYEAAKKHPDMYAAMNESIGGGAYGDDNVTDEFYWAACELYITTGDKGYYNDMKASEHFLTLPDRLDGGESVDTIGSFDWGNTAALGTLSLALNPDAAGSDSGKVKDNIIKAADSFLKVEEEQGYGLPYGSSTIAYNDSDSGYQWGSNSFVADNSVVIAYAYLLDGGDKYLDGVISGMDYLLGRNPMDYSYVTGYGDHTAENPHHRYWSNQIDDAFPKAPCGVLVGGPNSGLQDPWVKGAGMVKGDIAPAKCYLDNVEAWSVNECTINWNASLAWITAFTAQENGGIVPGSTGELAGVSNNGGGAESNSDEKTYDEEEAKEEVEKAKEEKSEKDSSKKEKSDSSEKSEKSNIPLIALIIGGIVVVIISTEVFIYKVLKLKSGSKPGGGEEK